MPYTCHPHIFNWGAVMTCWCIQLQSSRSWKKKKILHANKLATRYKLWLHKIHLLRLCSVTTLHLALMLVLVVFCAAFAFRIQQGLHPDFAVLQLWKTLIKSFYPEFTKEVVLDEQIDRWVSGWIDEDFISFTFWFSEPCPSRLMPLTLTTVQ